MASSAVLMNDFWFDFSLIFFFYLLNMYSHKKVQQTVHLCMFPIDDANYQLSKSLE